MVIFSFKGSIHGAEDKGVMTAESRAIAERAQLRSSLAQEPSRPDIAAHAKPADRQATS